jgi:MFS family permease
MSDGPSPYAPLKIANFRWFIASSFFVSMGGAMQGYAVGKQVYDLTRSEFHLGLIGLAGALPFIASALFAGHVVDKCKRHTVAWASMLGQFACTVALVALSFLPGVPGLLWWIYGVIMVSAVMRSFHMVSRSALVGELVPRELLAMSVSWRTATFQISGVCGPAIAGFIYSSGGAGSSYAINLALICVGLGFLALVRGAPAAPPSQHETMIKSLGQGVRYVFNNKVILGAMSLDLFAVLLGGAEAMLPAIADQILHVDAKGLGLLRSASAMGAFAMMLIMIHRPSFDHAGKVLLGTVAGFGLCMIGLGLSTSFWVSMAFLFLSGAFDYVSVMIRHSLVQLLTPPRLLGRVSAVNSIFIGSSNEIGAFESGVTARMFGLVRSIVIGGTLTMGVVAAIAWRIPPLRKLRRVQDLQVVDPNAAGPQPKVAL